MDEGCFDFKRGKFVIISISIDCGERNTLKRGHNRPCGRRQVAGNTDMLDNPE
jgi:hypothetical protein